MWKKSECNQGLISTNSILGGFGTAVYAAEYDQLRGIL